MELSEQRLNEWLKHFKINEENGYRPIQIHASGHACGPEIQQLINSIKPKRLVPIHTEKPKKFENRAREVVEPQKGVKLNF